MWCGRQENQVPRVIAKRLGEPEVLRRSGLRTAARTRKVMRLIEDNHIPARRREQSLHASRLLQRVNRRNYARASLPRSRAIVLEVLTEHIKQQSESSFELAPPVLDQ